MKCFIKWVGLGIFKWVEEIGVEISLQKFYLKLTSLDDKFAWSWWWKWRIAIFRGCGSRFRSKSGPSEDAPAAKVDVAWLVEKNGYCTDSKSSISLFPIGRCNLIRKMHKRKDLADRCLSRFYGGTDVRHSRSHWVGGIEMSPLPNETLAEGGESCSDFLPPCI